MTAPTKPLSLWNAFYGLIKYLSSFIVSNKHETEPNDEEKCLPKPVVDCKPLQCIPSISRNTFDQVFITDSDEMYQWASKDTYMFTTFKFLHKFTLWRFFCNSVPPINPCWRSVLKLDEVLNKNAPIEVTDTLILHCESIESYCKVIPRIRGSYSILTLHGHTTWHQIKQLYHPGVKQMRINARFEISPNEYDEFVNFVKEYYRGWGYIFSIAYEAKCPLDILRKLRLIFFGKSVMNMTGFGYDFNSHGRFVFCVSFCTYFPCIVTAIVYFMLLLHTNIGVHGIEALSALVFVILYCFMIFPQLTSPVDVKVKVLNDNFNYDYRYITETL